MLRRSFLRSLLVAPVAAYAALRAPAPRPILGSVTFRPLAHGLFNPPLSLHEAYLRGSISSTREWFEDPHPLAVAATAI